MGTEEVTQVACEESNPPDKLRNSKSQGGNKRWRKRMQNFLLSPVHLVRRIVFRSKRASRKQKKEHLQNIALPEQVEIAKRRGLPCYFLFLGVPGCGKSTTISKLFNVERPTKSQQPSDPVVKIYENSDVCYSLGLKVVDTPGITDSTNVPQALSSFLHKDLPCRIPTITFLLAPLHDNQTDNDKSLVAFTQMLEHLKSTQSLPCQITDFKISNFAVLLTHAQKAEDSFSSEEFAKLLASYQDAVSQVFQTETRVPCIPIENIRKNSKGGSFKRFHNTIYDSLREIAVKREERSLSTLVGWLAEDSKRFSVDFSSHVISLRDLLTSSEPSNSPLDFHEDSNNFQPYFVLLNVPKKKRKSTDVESDKSNSFVVTNEYKMLTCMSPGSQVVLADNRVIKIEDCLVGDKLLSLEHQPSVVAGVARVKLDNPIFSKNVAIGTVYCEVKRDVDETSQDKMKKKFIYMFENESFVVVDTAKTNVPEKRAKREVYCVQLDKPGGTFVVSGFPCFSHVSCDDNQAI